MELPSNVIIKNTPIVQVGQGQDYLIQLYRLAYTYFLAQRRTLASIYNEENQSTSYAIHLRARAREMARFRYHLDRISNDASINTVRPELLYQNFGYLLELDTPFFFPNKSDDFYRRFLTALLGVILKGSNREAITEGISIFTEGIPFSVRENYLDSLAEYKRNKKLNSLINTNTNFSSEFILPDITDNNKFTVSVNVSDIPLGTDLDFIYQGIRFFLEIMKPSHTAYDFNFSVNDTYDSSSAVGVLKPKVYKWFYDDLRRCGAYREKQITQTFTGQPTLLTVVTDGSGNGVLAQPEDITIYVNNDLVNVEEINPFTGEIVVPGILSTDTVEVTYYYSVNLSTPLIHNLEGSYYNQYGSYSSVYNGGEQEQIKKCTYKTSAFFLPASSLYNLEYTLIHNGSSIFDGVYNRARILHNYEKKECRINPITSSLGLSTEGVTLNYPTPPIPLRFNAEGNSDFSYELEPAQSDILNSSDDLLNDKMLLNQAFFYKKFNNYGSKYAFYQIDKQCQGTKVLKSFCDNGFTVKIGFSDFFQDSIVIKNHIDILYHNSNNMNEACYYGVGYSGVRKRVRQTFEESISISDSTLEFKPDITIRIHDIYKAVKNVLFYNMAQTEEVPGPPIIGFDENEPSLLFNFDLNDVNGILNDAVLTEVGVGPSTTEIEIPPSHVMPGDGIDVLPPELKTNPGDTNYVYFGKESFSENITFTLSASFGDTYYGFQDNGFTVV